MEIKTNKWYPITKIFKFTFFIHMEILMKKVKSVLAIILVAILIGLYILTFVMALLDNSATMYLFKGCIGLTVFIPVVFYIFSCLHKWGMIRSGRASEDDDTSNISE